MTEDLRDLLGAIAHNVKIGLGDAGRRASASALRSVFKDGKRFVQKVDDTLGEALEKLETVIRTDKK